jgi:hypothetical protein
VMGCGCGGTRRGVKMRGEGGGEGDDPRKVKTGGARLLVNYSLGGQLGQLGQLISISN